MDWEEYEEKFYKCMKDPGYIEGDQNGYLCSVIKENMELWQEDCVAFNDPNEEYPFDLWQGIKNVDMGRLVGKNREDKVLI